MISNPNEGLHILSHFLMLCGLHMKILIILKMKIHLPFK